MVAPWLVETPLK